MHEAPKVSNYFSGTQKGGNDFHLQTGLVLAIEPMVSMGGKNVRCLNDDWTQVTVDGSCSAHFEHTVALTKDGP